MQRLYLQRHGHAEIPKGGGERVLTSSGRAALGRAVQGLAAGGGLGLAAIGHSPLARSRQTAELMRPLLLPAGRQMLCPALAPDGDPQALAAWLEGHLAGAAAVLLIGHMPEVAMWTARWSGSPAAGQDFAPGTMARLDIAGGGLEGGATLRWLRSVEALAAPTVGPD